MIFNYASCYNCFISADMAMAHSSRAKKKLDQSHSSLSPTDLLLLLVLVLSCFMLIFLHETIV